MNLPLRARERYPQCVGRCNVDSEMYQLRRVPGFAVCVFCFDKHVRPHEPYARQFDLTSLKSPRSHCMFDRLRVKKVWQEVLSRGSIEPLVDFAAHRVTIQECKGFEIERGISRPDGSKQFTCTEIRDVAICEACYEDYLVPAGFANMFYPNNGAQGDWICDCSYDVVKRALEKFGATGDYTSFTQLATRRMSLGLNCPGKVADRALLHYKTGSSVPAYVCEVCYMDKILFSRAEREWGATVYADPQRNHCTFSIISLNIAWTWQLDLDDAALYQKFENACHSVLSTSSCGNPHSPNGSSLATWTIDNGNLDLCHGCFMSLVDFAELDPQRQFQQIRPQQSRSCTLSYRIMTLLPAIERALNTNNLHFLRQRASEVRHFRQDCAHQTRANTRWYGNDHFSVCENCFYSRCIDSSFYPSTLFTIVGRPGDGICDLWSPRMSRLWRVALDSNNWTEFLAHVAQRRKVWAQVGPQIDSQMAMAKMKAQQHSTAAMAGVMLHGADNLQMINNNFNTHAFHSMSSGNTYASVAGIQAEQMTSKMNTASMSVQQHFAVVKQLLAAWTPYE